MSYTRRDKGWTREGLTRVPGTRRHLPGDHPTRTLCGGSIAWCNVTTDPKLATCPTCNERAPT